jgi:plastocyanin
MGPPSSPEGTQIHAAGGDVNAFFPRGVAIHRNDSVKFVPRGLHTVDLPPGGASGLRWFGPTGDTVSGQNDAAGKEFWFNGHDQVFFNSAIPKTPAPASYDGTTRVDSGIAPGPKGRTLTVKFAKTGTFNYFCDLHPGMNGTVVVRPANRKVALPKSDANRVKAQLKKALRIFKPLPRRSAPLRTVSVGSAGRDGVEYYGFLPAPRGVQAGDTVTFRVSASSFEAHTATFGPQPYRDELAGSFGGSGPFDPRAFYPSDPANKLPSYTSGLHGNGFWNSGVIDNSTTTSLPSSKRLKFTTAGTYDFYCLIHPAMHSKVTVYKRVPRDTGTGGQPPPPPGP